MTSSLGRLASSLFLYLLMSVIEMRSLCKGFYSTAANTARAGKNDPFPCRYKDIFITVSFQQNCCSRTFHSLYNANREAFKRERTGQDRGDERSHPLAAAGKKKPMGEEEVRKMWKGKVERRGEKVNRERERARKTV